MWRPTGHDAPTPHKVLADFFDKLDARELDHVRRYVGHTEHRILRGIAICVNRLSNGALYPIVALFVITIAGRPMLAAVLVAASAVLVAHTVYPIVKGRCARQRPCDCDPSIVSLLKPLDRHSFPSGHTMTATAAFLPLSAAMPVTITPWAFAAVVLISWARIAAGHHYPSDVFAGALLGSLIASPGVAWLLH